MSGDMRIRLQKEVAEATRVGYDRFWSSIYFAVQFVGYGVEVHLMDTGQGRHTVYNGAAKQGVWLGLAILLIVLRLRLMIYVFVNLWWEKCRDSDIMFIVKCLQIHH